MVKHFHKYLIFVLIVWFSSATAQPDTFVRISANPQSVKIKQPFILRISVYTTTWFTSAPNLDNIVIPGALTIKKDRAQSTYQTINDTRYTILYFEFFVFPARTGELTIPEIKLNYATPETGDFKGVEIERTTKPITIIVDPIDPGYTLSNWLVANAFSVSENWNRDLNKLKVGDVPERTITIKASGTIAALLPASDSLDISWSRTYPATPILKNEIREGIIHAERIEKTSFLAEKPGKFIVNQQSYSWWNPITKKISTRKLAEKKIIIKENPDLAILKSIQDSLDALNIATQEGNGEKRPFTIFGLLLWQFLIILAVASIIIKQMHKLILYAVKKIRERKEAYTNSEKFYFTQFAEACKQNDLKIIWTHLSKWVVHMQEMGNISVGVFVTQYGNEQLVQQYGTLEKDLFGEKSSKIPFDRNGLFTNMALARTKYIQQSQLKKKISTVINLNP